MYNVLVLSLEEDLERRKHITKVCSELGLEFEFFNAYTPKDLPFYFKEIYLSKLDIYQFPKLNHDAIKATFYSHTQLLKKIFNSKQHTLVLEDDLIPIRDFDYNNVDFESFDVLQLMSEVSCCSQFVNWKAAGDIFSRLFKAEWYPSQAFDWELFKLKSEFNIQTVENPIFKQSEEFISNLAPNGY